MKHNFPGLLGTILLTAPDAATIAHVRKQFMAMFGVKPDITINGRFGAMGAIQTRVLDVGDTFVTLNAQGPAIDPTTGDNVTVAFTTPPPRGGK